MKDKRIENDKSIWIIDKRANLVGLRVKRGPNWEWGDQDGGGVGTIAAVRTYSGWVEVDWDNEYGNTYRLGGGFQDLISDDSDKVIDKTIINEDVDVD